MLFGKPIIALFTTTWPAGNRFIGNIIDATMIRKLTSRDVNVKLAANPMTVAVYTYHEIRSICNSQQLLPETLVYLMLLLILKV